MEPNPSVFLRAIRREALGTELFGAGIASGSSNAIMQRAAEVLAHLVVRREKLPGMLRNLHAEPLSILRSIARRLDKHSIGPPAAIVQALERAESLGPVPGEADVDLYEMINRALADGIRALKTLENPRSDIATFISDACRIICSFEVKLHHEYSLQLERLKNADLSNLEQPLDLPSPTEVQLSSYLRMRFPNEPEIKVRDVRALVGVNSKDIFFFDLSGSRELDGSYVMRREPAFNVTQVALVTEYELLLHLKQAGAPVPRALLGEGNSSHFGGGFCIIERLPGATRSSNMLGANSTAILKEIARICARIHAIEIPRHLPQFQDVGLSTQDRMLGKVDAMYQRWKNERSDDSAIIESAYHWLHENVRCLDETTVLIHGDYSLRNILLDGDRVSGILDWELCHANHPAEDVAYIRPFVEPAMPWDQYLAEYRAHSAHEVTDAALRYFEVWSEFWRLVLTACSYSGYHLNKHRHFLFASTSCVEYREYSSTLARLITELS